LAESITRQGRWWIRPSRSILVQIEQFADIDSALRQIDTNAVAAATGFTGRLAADAVRQRMLIAACFAAVGLIASGMCLFLYRMITRPSGGCSIRPPWSAVAISRSGLSCSAAMSWAIWPGRSIGCWGELTELVNQAQRSSVQVNSTVNQIASSAASSAS
jgi:hypothetical protein